MANYRSRAGYQYETSPRKLEPEYRQPQKKYPKKSTAKKAKQQQETKKKHVAQKIKAIGYVAIFFAVLFAISYRNTVISEKYSQIKTEKSNLAAVEKENEQLEVNIESKTNLGAIEKEAKDKLGMKKLNDKQTVYVDLEKQDYVESATDDVIMNDAHQTFFQKIVSTIKNWF